MHKVRKQSHHGNSRLLSTEMTMQNAYDYNSDKVSCLKI